MEVMLGHELKVMVSFNLAKHYFYGEAEPFIKIILVKNPIELNGASWEVFRGHHYHDSVDFNRTHRCYWGSKYVWTVTGCDFRFDL